jgi:4-carboxymuconolactone decarboxylase
MTSELFKKGMKIRTEVLGEAYVKKAMAGMDEFNRPLQELVTEYLAMISALNRPQELKAHIRGAITNGVTREQISEVLLQVAIYVGVPAAVDSFRIARETFAEIDGG